ncbi:lipopolysaccharide assembly protein LapB [Pseudomonas sp. CES]|uniref:tetratricopeptide repeat protein n=1 Tax=Pseudomonas sp. CES TaxID=2719586 RepID=UPI00146FFB1E|nr:tetratricopeptide repeat protein [Pseudomonas sp. CES]KAF4560185.1 hypothetical protein HBJ16_002263 [Pseudomonas sp. CES]
MKNKSATHPARTVVGYLDSISDGHALGWAYTPSSPSENLTVTMYHGNRIVGQGIANIFREDLITAGIGNGYYSFKIPLSYELANGENHEISARVLGTNTDLSGSPKTTAYFSKFEFNLISRKEGRLELEKISDSLIKTGKIKSSENLLKAFELASMLQETMKLKDAGYAWNALKQTTGSEALFTCKQAELLLLSGQYDGALERYLEAAAVDFTSAWAHIGVTDCHYLLKNYTESLRAARAALELHPQNLTIRAQFAKLEKLLTPPDPAENKFVQRFAHLSALLSSGVTQKTVFSTKQNGKPACKNDRTNAKQLTAINDALRKINELRDSINKFHALRPDSNIR